MNEAHIYTIHICTKREMKPINWAERIKYRETMPSVDEIPVELGTYFTNIRVYNITEILIFF